MEKMEIRKEIFSFGEAQKKYSSSIMEFIKRKSDSQRDMILPPENVIAYSHGRGWVGIGEENEERAFEEHGHEESIKYEDILEHKVSLVSEFLGNMINGIHSDFMRYMYGVISETTEKTNNVVNAQEYSSPAEAFYEMMRKVDFSVNREGAVSKPEIHMNPSYFKKFDEHIRSQSDEFKEKIENLTIKKEL